MTPAHDEHHTILLTAKLAHPRLPITLVARERLLLAMDAALEHRLTLVSASAGWGKTTLLSAWTSAQSHPVAWLSLDALDNDPARFCLALIAALRSSVPALGAAALALLQSPEPAPLTAVLTLLLNELELRPSPTPIMLILDDYHLIDDLAIHEAVTFLLDHLPAKLHLVIASRTDPELPLSRWRVRGELTEIRSADLRFSAVEAASFFTHSLGSPLPEEDVRLLAGRTEGWVAGLQLAALALRQREDRSAFVQAFTGNHRYLLDYVQEEILQQQPLAVQNFLLQTALLRRMNAALAIALTGDTNSQTMLQWLERNNLFVVPLDELRQWYRVHELFREVLLARLHATQPALVPQLHGRAAHWFADQGDLREAVPHALAAADYPLATSLIARAAARLWFSGEAHVVHGWIGALPDAVLLQHSRLALDAALRLLQSYHATVSVSFAHVQAQAEHTIARVEALLQKATRHELPEGDMALLGRRIGLLRALIASRPILTSGDTAGMQRLAQETEQLAKNEEIGWRMVALAIAFWLVESLQREGALLIPRLLEAKQQASAAGDQSALVRVMLWLAVGYSRAARLHLVQRECSAALALLERSGAQTGTAAYLYYFLVDAYFSRNQLAEAWTTLQSCLSIARAWQQADLLIIGNVGSYYIAQARGDLDAAAQSLLQAQDLVQQERFATHSGFVAAAWAHYWLATGNLEAASSWAEQVQFSAETWDPNRKGEFLLLLRVYLAQQRHAAALSALDRCASLLDRAGDRATAIDFLALHALALQGVGETARARAELTRMLVLTEPEGHIRDYLAGGEAMRQLLQDLRNREDSTLPAALVAYISRLLVAFAQQGSGALQHTPPEQKAPLGRSPERSNALIEPLTPREQQVLRLLVAGASNQEIAAELVISLATVKKHVSNVLAKLGVTSRAQAIARARDSSYFN